MRFIFLLIFIMGCGRVSLIDQISAGIGGEESRSCSIQPPNSSGGIQSSLDNGRTWTACYLMDCDSGYIISELQTSCIKKIN